VRKTILQGIRQLEDVNVTGTELNVRINDELSEMEDFAAQMEGVPETRLLPDFGCQSPKGRGSLQKVPLRPQRTWRA
jgi:hypothetical protein